MFYNEICNFIILITIVILIMNVQILQSIPPMFNQCSKHGIGRTQKVYQQNKNDADKIKYFRKLTNNELLSNRIKFKKGYNRKIDYTNGFLLGSKKVFDRNERSFANWFFQNNDLNDRKEETFFNKIKNISSYVANSKNIDIYDQSMNKNWNYGDLDQQNDNNNNYPDEDWYNEDYYENLQNYDHLTSIPFKTKTQIQRREALPKKRIENASLYPSVLTKAVEITMNPSTCAKSGGNLLANVAQKMNTNILDLANKLAASPTTADTRSILPETYQRFIKTNGKLLSRLIKYLIKKKKIK